MKNPFQEFEPDAYVPPLDATERPQGVAMGLLSKSRNPFTEFEDVPAQTIALPMDAILSEHALAMDALTEAYKRLIVECVGDSAWREDRASIVRTYEVACDLARTMTWRAEDIEAFGAHALRRDDPDFFLIGPLGLFLSAFCNASSEDRLRLDLSGQNLRLPLVGYRLRAGLSLVVTGNLGDLTGISLAGGHLTVNGNVGSHLGAGMTGGRIDVSGDAGRSVGEQMADGEIHIEGRLGGMGHPQGGKVFHRSQQMY